MGRTVPTWRIRIEKELGQLEHLKKALNFEDRLALELLVDGVRKRRSAGGMLPAHDVWKPMLISMLLECCQRLYRVEQMLHDLEG